MAKQPLPVFILSYQLSATGSQRICSKDPVQFGVQSRPDYATAGLLGWQLIADG